MEWLYGLLALLIAAAGTFVGRLWGGKKYKDGYTDGSVDQVEQMRRATERARDMIKYVDEQADKDAYAAHEAADDRASDMLGRRPTNDELEEFLRGP